jgi:plasmid stabilization system protein ParE
MKYHLQASARAERQLNDIAQWWSDHHSHEQAERWYLTASRAIESLRETADRCPRSMEDGLASFPLFQLAFGVGRRRTHRVLFTIKPDRTVYILAVRHLAQDLLTVGDLEIE